MEVKRPKVDFLSKHCDNNFYFPLAEDNDTEVSSVAPPTPREAPPTSTAPTNQADTKNNHVTSANDRSDSAGTNVIVNNVSSAV